MSPFNIKVPLKRRKKEPGVVAHACTREAEGCRSEFDQLGLPSEFQGSEGYTESPVSKSKSKQTKKWEKE